MRECRSPIRHPPAVSPVRHRCSTDELWWCRCTGGLTPCANARTLLHKVLADLEPDGMRRFLICIHDATPAYARETLVLIRDLAPLIGRRLSFGVVPNWHGDWPLGAHPGSDLALRHVQRLARPHRAPGARA